jgi:hypothetical protein
MALGHDNQWCIAPREFKSHPQRNFIGIFFMPPSLFSHSFENYLPARRCDISFPESALHTAFWEMRSSSTSHTSPIRIFMMPRTKIVIAPVRGYYGHANASHKDANPAH